MKKIFYIAAIFSMLMTAAFAEDINFFGRTTFANAQFWEAFHISEPNQTIYGYDMADKKVFANYCLGSIGVGLEWIIWDMGKKRGSRLFLRAGFDFIFMMGPTYFGQIPSVNELGTMKPLSLNGGVSYQGLDLDLYIGGTFPKTDLLWGFGSVFYFTFPTYAPNVGVENFQSHERFGFFAAPSVLLGYDIMIPNTKFKITPMLKAGITAWPLIPDDMIPELKGYQTGLRDQDGFSGKYSGFYFDLSVAFTFASIEWKK